MLARRAKNSFDLVAKTVTMSKQHSTCRNNRRRLSAFNMLLQRVAGVDAALRCFPIYLSELRCGPRCHGQWNNRYAMSQTGPSEVCNYLMHRPNVHYRPIGV